MNMRVMGNKSFFAGVNENEQLLTFAVTEDEAQQALNKGNSYNINTGIIAFTGTAASSFLYFKNDEDEPYVITGIAVGVYNRSVTVDNDPELVIYRNPTGGDIISDATAVESKTNNNFSSSNTLKSTTLAYAGKDGGTLTGGGVHARVLLSDGRSFATLNFELGKGAAIGFTIDIGTSGGCNAYMALIGYIKDPKNSNV